LRKWKFKVLGRMEFAIFWKDCFNWDEMEMFKKC